MKRAALAVAGLAAAAAGAAWLMQGSPQAEPAGAARHVVAAEAIAPDVLISGRLEWRIAHAIHAPADGVLRDLLVANAEPVEPGQTILSIGSPQVEDESARAALALLQARAQLRQFDELAQGTEMLQQRAALADAESQLGQLRRREQTVRELVAAGIAPRQELTEIAARIEDLSLRRLFARQVLEGIERRQSPEARRVLEQQVALAETANARLETLRAALVVRSPGSGRFLVATAQSAGEAPRQAGEAIRRGERIGAVADPDRHEVSARADEADAARIAVGAVARVRFALDPGADHAGRVREVRRAPRPPGALAVTEEYLVTVDLDRPARGLLPGASALVRVATPERQAMLVPLGYVRLQAGRAQVSRVDPATGRAELVSVLPGAPVGDRVELTGDLRAGDVLLEMR
jgi:multidrug efflux pump subunit AcrA (membrane-fusion protein)